MLFLFGTKIDYEDKEDGRIEQKICPACKELASFREQIQVENFHIFFIPLFAVKKLDEDTRLYECGACGKRFSIIEGQFGNVFNRFRRKDKNGRQAPEAATSQSAPSANSTAADYDVETDFTLLRDRVSKKQI